LNFFALSDMELVVSEKNDTNEEKI
jgi:hypothetical protein